VKRQQAAAAAAQFAFRTQLEDPEFVFRALSFANFVATWIVRCVDPAHKHPNPVVALPLPKEVPMAFRVLPEYMFEDVVETMLFYAR
jgi:ubiquitin conjugation factor E4 B